MQETQVQSLGWEDPLEKDVATHSSILAWEIPCTEEPGGLCSYRSLYVNVSSSFILNCPNLEEPKCPSVG